MRGSVRPHRTIDDVLRDVFSFERVLADHSAGGASAIETKVYRRTGDKLTGSVARVRRGDLPISNARAAALSRSMVGLGFLHHPLFELLRHPSMGEHRLRRVLWALAPALSVPMFELVHQEGRITTMRSVVSPDMCDALCLQADHYSLAALFAIVLEAQATGHGQLALHAAGRAAQCLAFASAGELSVIWIPLLARARQQILDTVQYRGKRWEFEQLGFSELRLNVEAMIAMDSITYQGEDGRFTSILRRRALSVAEYLARKARLVSSRRPISAPTGLPQIAMQSRIAAGGGPPAKFGAGALAIMKRDLGQYWPGAA